MPIRIISGKESDVQNQINAFFVSSKNPRIVSYSTTFCDVIDGYWVEHSVLVEFSE